MLLHNDLLLILNFLLDNLKLLLLENFHKKTLIIDVHADNTLIFQVDVFCQHSISLLWTYGQISPYIIAHWKYIIVCWIFLAYFWMRKLPVLKIDQCFIELYQSYTTKQE